MFLVVCVASRRYVTFGTHLLACSSSVRLTGVPFWERMLLHGYCCRSSLITSCKAPRTDRTSARERSRMALLLLTDLSRFQQASPFSLFASFVIHSAFFFSARPYIFFVSLIVMLRSLISPISEFWAFVRWRRIAFYKRCDHRERITT